MSGEGSVTVTLDREIATALAHEGDLPGINSTAERADQGRAIIAAALDVEPQDTPVEPCKKCGGEKFVWTGTGGTISALRLPCPTCNPVEYRPHWEGDPTPEQEAALAEVVRAAYAKMAAEDAPGCKPEQDTPATFKPQPLIATCRELISDWEKGAADADLCLSILRAALTDPQPQPVGSGGEDGGAEELTMIALALKNQGFEGCTPEEGVEDLIVRYSNAVVERDSRLTKEAAEDLRWIAAEGLNLSDWLLKPLVAADSAASDIARHKVRDLRERLERLESLGAFREERSR